MTCLVYPDISGSGYPEPSCRAAPGNFQANGRFRSRFPGRMLEDSFLNPSVQHPSWKDPSALSSWKLPGRDILAGKSSFHGFHRVLLDPSWKVPGNFLEPSRKDPGWQGPFLQNKVGTWFCGDLETESFLGNSWKDSVFRILPAIFLEHSCSAGRISSRIRSDFSDSTCLETSRKDPVRLEASSLADPDISAWRLSGRPSWKDPVRLEASRRKWHA